MPAPEKTCYNLRLLHKLFAAASLALLAATVWMFVQDHRREWKVYQATAQRIELRAAEWRRAQCASDTAAQRRRELEQAVADAQSKPLDPQLVRQFRDAVQASAERRGEAFDFRDWDAAWDRLREAAERPSPDDHSPAEPLATLRQRFLDRLQESVSQARFRETRCADARQLAASELDAAKARVALAIRGQLAQPEQAARQAVVDGWKDRVHELTLQQQAAQQDRQSLEDWLAQLTAGEDQARRALAEHQAELQRLETAQAERRSTYVRWSYGIPLPGKKLLELPFFDAFNSPLKIETLWNDELTQDYNFRDVRRFDRCTTCHQMQEKTLPGSAAEPAFSAGRSTLYAAAAWDSVDRSRCGGGSPADPRVVGWDSVPTGSSRSGSPAADSAEQQVEAAGDCGWTPRGCWTRATSRSATCGWTRRRRGRS